MSHEWFILRFRRSINYHHDCACHFGRLYDLLNTRMIQIWFKIIFNIFAYWWLWRQAKWPCKAATCIDGLSFFVFVFICYGNTEWTAISLYNHDQQTFENNLIYREKSYPIGNGWLWTIWGKKTKTNVDFNYESINTVFY